MRCTLLVVAALVGPAPALSAQGDSAASAAANQAANPGAATPAAGVAAPVANPLRASWLSDRQPLRVGDLLTIVVDEQTEANERTSTIATANRSHRARLGIGVDSAVRLGPSKEFAVGVEGSSRDVGDASRSGDLVAVLSVRVTGLDAAGNAKIEGAKTVSVDGRNQEVKLSGVIRPDDVAPDNTVASSRVADAVIGYKGKKIGPRQGILGKILSILWP
ncbi:MAG TPA: flagellar basal body L-ring protein FlgH [Gemmatimonadales bacterium]|nr:flagellar basal body L-ring protein FlgH [Gemmatimonadales bacterium]